MSLLGGILGSVVGGIFGKKQADRAADAQVKASQMAIDEQRRQFDATRSDFAPFREAGVNALGQLANPQANFMASPGYQFRLNEGTRALQNNRIASGTAKSGNALKALAEFGQNMASDEFGKWWNQQAGLAGAGQNATGAVGQFGAQAAGNIGNALINSGEARASGVAAGANALSQGLSGAVDQWNYFRNGPGALNYFTPTASRRTGNGQGDGLGYVYPLSRRYPNGGIGGGL